MGGPARVAWEVPPAGFLLRGRSRYFAIYTRC
jgi:hypothetical protein